MLKSLRCWRDDMRKYPEEVHRFIAENVIGKRTNELAEMVNEAWVAY